MHHEDRSLIYLYQMCPLNHGALNLIHFFQTVLYLPQYQILLSWIQLWLMNSAKLANSHPIRIINIIS